MKQIAMGVLCLLIFTMACGATPNPENKVGILKVKADVETEIWFGDEYVVVDPRKTGDAGVVIYPAVTIYPGLSEIQYTSNLEGTVQFTLGKENPASRLTSVIFRRNGKPFAILEPGETSDTFDLVPGKVQTFGVEPVIPDDVPQDE